MYCLRASLQPTNSRMNRWMISSFLLSLSHIICIFNHLHFMCSFYLNECVLHRPPSTIDCSITESSSLNKLSSRVCAHEWVWEYHIALISLEIFLVRRTRSSGMNSSKKENAKHSQCSTKWSLLLTKSACCTAWSPLQSKRREFVRFLRVWKKIENHQQ